MAEFYLAPPKQVAVKDGVRLVIKGKFIFVGEEKFYIRGVTYGPFRPTNRVVNTTIAKQWITIFR